MTHSRYPLLAVSSLLLLSACGAPAKSADLKTMLQNPLYAKQYYDAQVDDMVNLLIESGATLKDASAKAAIERTRVQGLALSKKAHDLKNTGKIGTLMSDTGEAGGDVLLLNGILYFGPEFQVHPEVDVHLYLSNVLDPRDGTFPDKTATDLGGVHTVIGATTYEVPAAAANDRTIVFYDRATKRIIGFSQLAGLN